MKELGERNYSLIRKGIHKEGTYDPSRILFHIEKDLLTHEAEEVYNFLKFVYDNNKKFGPSNYEAIFQEYLKSK